MKSASKDTFYEKILRRLGNNRVIAICLLMFTVLVGTAALTGALDGLWEFTQSKVLGRSKELRTEYCEFLRPLVAELDRTRTAFARWDQKDLSLESETMRDANLRIRTLLLEKGHLIPDSLREDQTKLILHYDIWLEEYDRIRVRKTADPDQLRVLARKSPFPRESELHFRERMAQVEAKLGNEPRCN